MCSRKYFAVSPPKRIAPSELPSSISWPWCQGPITSLTIRPLLSLPLIARYTAGAP
jgi:hypothetical protein